MELDLVADSSVERQQLIESLRSEVGFLRQLTQNQKEKISAQKVKLVAKKAKHAETKQKLTKYMCDIAEMKGAISELRRMMPKSEDRAIIPKVPESINILAETNKKVEVANLEALLKTADQVRVQDRAEIEKLIKAEVASKKYAKDLASKTKALEKTQRVKMTSVLTSKIELKTENFELRQIFGSSFDDIQEFTKQTIINTFGSSINSNDDCAGNKIRIALEEKTGKQV